MPGAQGRVLAVLVETTAELNLRPWRTRNQPEFATIEWIDSYNTARRHGELGHVPPAEHEAEWLAAHNPATMVTTQPS